MRLPEGSRQSEPLTHLYVHVPFCAARCSYCDFVFFVGQQGRAAEYFAALGTELETLSREMWWEPLRTIHFGGGTPSLVDPGLLAGLIRRSRERVGLAATVEIGVEANPSSTTPERAGAWRESGVSRVSLGVQCFDDLLLRSLGRRHGAEGARQAFADLRRAGFENLNLDLIYGIPGQDLDHWEETLQAAVELSPEHISCYALTLEPGTPLAARVASGAVEMPNEDQLLDCLARAEELLGLAGYVRYEVSNWARPGFESRHNLTYWRHLPYAGLGVGAHSFVPLETPLGAGGLRWWNTPELGRYLDQPAARVDGHELLGAELLAGEHLMLALRLRDGLPDWPTPRLGGRRPLERFGPELKRAEHDGLLRRTRGGHAPTRAGMALHNRLAERFLP
ncbi:MAG: radical SAM family heme chaperone HemW [Candidatus Dormibacteria bacterium]